MSKGFVLQIVEQRKNKSTKLPLHHFKQNLILINKTNNRVQRKPVFQLAFQAVSRMY